MHKIDPENLINLLQSKIERVVKEAKNCKDVERFNHLMGMLEVYEETILNLLGSDYEKEQEEKKCIR